jgi:hypothetical protein
MNWINLNRYLASEALGVKQNLPGRGSRPAMPKKIHAKWAETLIGPTQDDARQLQIFSILALEMT